MRKQGMMWLLAGLGLVVGIAVAGDEQKMSLDQVPEEEAAAKDYLERLAKPLRENGIEVDCLALPGSPGESIVKHAEDGDFDLVALATHGRSGFGRIVFGSVADHVVRNSGRPILLIKPTESAST